MKKTIILLSAVIALCAFTSCNKEPKDEHPLAGVWAFMSEEVIYKDADGKIVDQHKYEYNPFNPSTNNDMKVEFTWVSANDYSANSFEWNTVDKKWESSRPFEVSIRDGNKLFTTGGLNGEMVEAGTITFSGDMFILEGTRKKLSISLSEEDTGITEYLKETYKRMN